MESAQHFIVKVTIGGATQDLKFRLRHDTNVASVLACMKETCGVGMLSYDKNAVEVVDVLEADQEYYFVTFHAPQGAQAPPPAGKNASRDDPH